MRSIEWSSRGHVTMTTPLSGTICRRLGLAMFNPHTKFEVSTITCNEEMKCDTKCKNSRFEPPFGGLRGNALCHWKFSHKETL